MLAVTLGPATAGAAVPLGTAAGVGVEGDRHSAVARPHAGLERDAADPKPELARS